MSFAANGEVEIYYETFGDLSGPVILWNTGYANQCIRFSPELRRMLVDAGFGVIRYDHRDVGLSTKMGHAESSPPYTLADMAGDAVAILDDVGIERVHAVGHSMGGMIVQILAIEHPERLLTMTSISSSPGDPDVGQPAADVLHAMLNPPSPPPSTRDEFITAEVEHIRTWATPATFDAAALTVELGESYDRCFCPEGKARQGVACMAAPSRTEALRSVRVPALVLHGDEDRLVNISGGRRTADAIPNARFHVLEGMGHDLSPAYWPTIVQSIVDHAGVA